jgi:hypothetical protein
MKTKNKEAHQYSHAHATRLRKSHFLKENIASKNRTFGGISVATNYTHVILSTCIIKRRLDEDCHHCTLRLVQTKVYPGTN